MRLERDYRSLRAIVGDLGRDSDFCPLPWQWRLTWTTTVRARAGSPSVGGSTLPRNDQAHRKVGLGGREAPAGGVKRGSHILPDGPDDAEPSTEEDVAKVPRTINQKTGKKLLEKAGYRMMKGGKHNVKMVKDGERPITLPGHRGQECSVDLTRAILKQAGII